MLAAGQTRQPLALVTQSSERWYHPGMGAYDDLSPRRKRFVDAYVADPVATRAYAAAGYSPQRSNASRMIADDSVRDAVVERSTAVASDAHWDTARWVAAVGQIAEAGEAHQGQLAALGLLRHYLGISDKTTHVVAAVNLPESLTLQQLRELAGLDTPWEQLPPRGVPGVGGDRDAGEE